MVERSAKELGSQIASIRREIEAKKADHDLHAAQRRAVGAEDDAKFAIDLAHWAVEEAEWAALSTPPSPKWKPTVARKPAPEDRR